MAIQHRRGNFADFDPYKMRPGEWAFPLDRGEGYYCISPGDVRRVATKEEIIEILETNQQAYDGLQQLLTELEDETVLTGILADISQLLDDVAINKLHIADNRTDIDTNAQDIVNLDDKVNSHLAESAKKHIKESGSNDDGYYVKFDDGTMICKGRITLNFLINTIMFKTWTYPQPFKVSDSPYANAILDVNLASSTYAKYRGASMSATTLTGSADFRLCKETSTSPFVEGDEVTARTIAIGRWK